MLDPRQKAEVAAIIERDLRSTLYDVCRSTSPDPTEQIQIAGAVVTLLLRDLHRNLGTPWLEAAITAVLQPASSATSPL